jgi:hypothetical protein
MGEITAEALMIQLIEAVAEFFFWMAEEVAGVFFGHVGSWTVRLITFGKCSVDDQGWTAIIIGWCVVAFGIFCGVMYWKLNA